MLAPEPATTLRLPKIKARLLSGSTLGKARALFCALAVLSAVGVIVPIMTADQDLALRVSGAAAAASLGVYWFIGWRLGRFPLAGEPFEVLALFLALRVAPGHPFLPMCGLLLRSTYCGYPLALLRWAAWSGTIIAAAAIGHPPSVDEDVAPALALVIIPLVLPGFRNALVRLESSEERLHSLIENSSDVVTVLGDDLRIAWQAQSIKAVLGYDAGDWLGTRFSEHVHPDDRGKLADFAERAHHHPGYSRLLELRLRAADGHVRWFEIAASNRLHDESVRGFVLNIRDATDRRRLESERRTRELMQQRAATQRLEIEALRERMEAEHHKRLLRERLQHVQRLESVGALAGGVAHDFNNLLAIIMNYVSFVRDELPEGSQTRADVDEIGRAAERGAHLTEQLLAFGQRKIGETKVLDVAAVISGMRTLLDRPLGKHIELAYEPNDGLWPVEADPTDIEQIMLNLVVNARDALDGSGRIVAAADNVEVSATRAAELDMASGRYVCISVEDDGSGMDAETLQHVWEPFFTTKPPGEGSGLGLATVYGIARQAGGGVTISSTVDVGTRVDVYLPAIHERVQQAVDDDGSDAAPAPGCARRAQILLVEEDPAVRDALRGVLDRAGYRVVAADDAAQALELLTVSGTAYELLLTDVIMARMWGDELANRARECAPHVLVLFMSGYGERFLRRGRAPAPGPVLMKPVGDEALLREVAGLLESRPSSNGRSTQSAPSAAENSDRSNGEAEGPPMPTQGASR